MRQNRNGNTQTIPYGGYDILIRKGVRNDNDTSYSVIVTEPAIGGYLLKKTFPNIKTLEKESQSIEKAKKFIRGLIIAAWDKGDKFIWRGLTYDKKINDQSGNAIIEEIKAIKL